MNPETKPMRYQTQPNDRPNITLLAIARQYATIAGEKLKDRLVSVLLFGSVARQEAYPESDIDLIIVMRDLPQGRMARKRLLAPVKGQLAPLLEEAVQKGFHPTFTELIYTPEEARRFRPLYLDLTQEAIILHDQNDFFQTLLKQVRRRLDSLGARRIQGEAGWYWDLKPDFQPGEVVEI